MFKNKILIAIIGLISFNNIFCFLKRQPQRITIAQRAIKSTNFNYLKSTISRFSYTPQELSLLRNLANDLERANHENLIKVEHQMTINSGTKLAGQGALVYTGSAVTWTGAAAALKLATPSVLGANMLLGLMGASGVGILAGGCMVLAGAAKAVYNKVFSKGPDYQKVYNNFYQSALIRDYLYSV